MEKSKILERAEIVLESMRPYLKIDDGDITLIDFEEDTHTLVVEFLGNCKDCPLSLMTLRAGVEKLILKNLPMVRRVEQL